MGWEEDAKELKNLVGCEVGYIYGFTSSGRRGDSDILKINLVCKGVKKELTIESFDTYSGSGLKYELTDVEKSERRRV